MAYTLISSQTLGSSAASVTFSSIPSTYKDLVLKVSTRSDDTGGSYFRIYVNNDTGSTYSSTTVQGNGSVAASNRSSSGGLGVAYNIYQPCTAETANTFSSVEVYIPAYTASQYKPVGTASANETNAATQTQVEAARAGLWSSTAAITSIQVSNVSTINFVTGSSFYLYGI